MKKALLFSVAIKCMCRPFKGPVNFQWKPPHCLQFLQLWLCVRERGNLFSVSCCTSQSESPGIKRTPGNLPADRSISNSVSGLWGPGLDGRSPPPTGGTAAGRSVIVHFRSSANNVSNKRRLRQLIFFPPLTIQQCSCCQLYSAASEPYSGPNADINKWLYNHFILMLWLWNGICLYMLTFILKLIIMKSIDYKSLEALSKTYCAMIIDWLIF